MSTPDFAPYCEQACRQYWGDPTSEKPRILRWAVGDYLRRVYDRKKRCWYDSEAGRGGSTLQLAALALGLAHDAKIEGETFQRCWRYATEHWGVPAPSEPGQGNGRAGGQPWKFIAEYIYRDANGAPHTRVRKYIDETGKKQFPQAGWDGKRWINGKPAGPKIPYNLPALAAAPPGTIIYIAEGEKDADALAKIGLTATTASEGAKAPWAPELTPYFKDRRVAILVDADKDGRAHGQKVARALDTVAKSIKVVDLYPERSDGSDVSDWLKADAVGVKLLNAVKAAPDWEPTPEPPESDTSRSDDELIAELAALPRLAYAKRRKEVAKQLGITVAELDKIVAEARGESSDKEGPPALYEHWAVEPWEESVDTGILLRALTEAIRRFVFLSDDQAVGVALWITFSWLHEQATHSPILFVTSAEKDSGKSTLLGVVNFLARRALQSVDITGAALFRSIAKWQPTLIVDEADDALDDNVDLRSNSGWTRGQGVIRCHPDTHEPELFSTFAPKVVGMKGHNLPDTTLSRSIAITMKPRRADDPKEHTDDFSHCDTETFARLRSQLLRWATDNAELLAKAEPEIPSDFRNRRRANWVPLLAIGEAGAEDWKTKAWTAALAIETVAAMFDPSIGVQLLQAIKGAFEARGVDRITSAGLIADLTADETGPWATYNKGKAISQRQVAKLLRPYGIKPGTIRLGDGSTLKGYIFAWFKDAFERHCSSNYAPGPGSTDSIRRTDTDLFSQGFSQFPSVTLQGGVTDKNDEKPLDNNNVPVCRIEMPPEGEEGNIDAQDTVTPPSEQCTQGMDGGPEIPPGAELIGRASAGGRCHICGSGSGVYLIRRRPGEEPAQVHPTCAVRAWTPAANYHTCGHCGGMGGAMLGPGQFWMIAGQDVWLHERCEAAYYEAHADEPPPWQPPEDGPP
jgi:5S rRNA maturation endonuclease (ribonuclease M5)